MLGRRGDAAALPFARESLRSADEAVRLAAIPAATRLGGEAVLPDLLPLLGSADADESAVLKTALVGYPGRLVVPEAVRLLDGTPLPGKAVLIEVLGEKGARDQVERVFRLAEDPDPVVREAALAALGQLAADTDLPRLVPMLEKASASDEVVRLREAIAAAVLRNPDPERRADGLLALLKNATPAGKIAILKVLPRVGGTSSLRAAVEETASRDPDVESAAVGALSRWPDDAAAGELLRIASTTRNREHFRMAVQGYVRLVGRSEAPAAKKLAEFRKLLALPAEDGDRKAVLAGVAGVREPESLRLLAQYLDNPALHEAAVAGLLDLASEQSPEERWLSGHEAYSVLRRVEASLTDPAARERASRTILDRLRQGGYVPLFDGRSLDGWKGLVADPPARAKMTPPELAKAQAAADDEMRAHWKVVDGALAFDGKGESLCTTSDYADFELLADWKIEKGGDSGLYLRGSPQVQIWDPEANPVGSGGLYNNEKGSSQPSEKADRPVGEWNAFRVLMIGDRVTVYLNDKRVVDNTVLENYWERDKPIYPSGQIELQAHGNPLWFRNVFIRAIPRDAPAPAIVAGRDERGLRASLQRPRPRGLDRQRRRLSGGGRQDRRPSRAPRREPVHGEGVHGLRPPLRVQALSGREQRPRHPRPARGRRRLRRDGDPDPRGRLTRVLGPPAVPVPRLDLRRLSGAPGRAQAGRRVERRGGHGQGPAGSPSSSTGRRSSTPTSTRRAPGGPWTTGTIPA